jgi:serine/threonine protein kinase
VLDPVDAESPGDLARCLNHVYAQAGMPALRALEQQTAKTAGGALRGTRLRSIRLGRSSLNDVLRGHKFPRKEFLLTFVDACGIDLQADPRWEEAWDRVALRHRFGPVAGQDPGEDHGTAWRQLAEVADRAERAEAENAQLRRQLADALDRARAAGEDARPGARAGRPGPARAALRGTASGELRRWDPERIGPFTILGRLGAGAMGQVYLGRSQAGRLVAVKTIMIELAEEPGFRERFAHEVAAARRVSGMFTASVVAADPEADVPWLATAYVPAPTLSQLVRSCGTQRAQMIWWLAAGCAEALESIHHAGLVHRDLKPSNVLVAPSGPLVIDFGVARAAERIQLTATAGAIGTPAYMAPEQARDSRLASAASDVFALGATLLFAATGHAPYQGDTVMDVLVRLATEPPDISGLAPELTELITACLQPRPTARPTTTALLAQLAPVINAAPLHPGNREADAPHPFLDPSAMNLIEEYQRDSNASLYGLRAAGPADSTQMASPDAR